GGGPPSSPARYNGITPVKEHRADRSVRSDAHVKSRPRQARVTRIGREFGPGPNFCPAVALFPPVPLRCLPLPRPCRTAQVVGGPAKGSGGRGPSAPLTRLPFRETGEPFRRTRLASAERTPCSAERILSSTERTIDSPEQATCSAQRLTVPRNGRLVPRSGTPAAGNGWPEFRPQNSPLAASPAVPAWRK